MLKSPVERKGVWMLGETVHMRVAGDIELSCFKGTSEGTTEWQISRADPYCFCYHLPLFLEEDNLFSGASSSLHPSHARARLEAAGMAVRSEEGSGELGFEVSISIPALDAARSPEHPQVLCNQLASKLTSEALINSGKVFRGC